MSDYTRQKDFSVKDALATGNPDKLVKGADVDAELDAVVTAVATKIDKVSAPTVGNVPILAADGTLTDSGLDPDDFATGTDLGDYATLASPTFTGTVTLPTGTVGVTQSAGDNSTSLATTAYADAAAGWAFTSSAITLTSGTNQQATAAHSLGAVPKMIGAYIQCVTTENNYAVGDIINLATMEWTGAGNFQLYADSTNVGAFYTSGLFTTGTGQWRDKSTAANCALTLANWKLYLVATA